jgi:hypothetical protein
MSATFSITLVALQPDGGRASVDFGQKAVGQMAAEELRQLLERFRTLDPIELVTADPEIIIEHRRAKFVVRAGEGKLYFQDRSKFDELTLALTSSEIVAELDGTAKAERSRRVDEAKEREVAALAELKQTESAMAPVELHPPSVLGRRCRVGLVVVTIWLLAYIGFLRWRTVSIEGNANFEPLSGEQEIARHRAEIVGVYMTGSQPGDHGIALTADGTIRLFTLNPKSPPSQIQDTFQLGRSVQQLCLRTHQPGGMIRFTDPDTLTFCQESYHRLR